MLFLSLFSKPNLDYSLQTFSLLSLSFSFIFPFCPLYFTISIVYSPTLSPFCSSRSFSSISILSSLALSPFFPFFILSYLYVFIILYCSLSFSLRLSISISSSSSLSIILALILSHFFLSLSHTYSLSLISSSLSIHLTLSLFCERLLFSPFSSFRLS